MSKPVIIVENLSKAYRIGLKEEFPDTFVGALTGWMKAPLRNWRRLRRLDTARHAPGPGDRGQGPDPNGKAPTARSRGPNGHRPALDSRLSTLGPPPTRHSRLTTDQDDIIWALRDVSFEVHEGEVVGIVGRNGAGKSTLLKILSRITEPTSGRAVIRGRVSSLLEVGTGFHPELTGRENIYMNGTILGMTKREIDRKFDEIVEFSGVEKFLDTPTKRYSSGMQVRVAFAVAAHLEPEILVIDEVLAVGDAEFQKKCLGKMKDVAAGGRTVLFVSHNMAAVQNLCTTGILLADGSHRLRGAASDVVAEYSRTIGARSGFEFDLASAPRRNAGFQRVFRALRFLDAAGNPARSYAPGAPITIEFDLHFAERQVSPRMGIGVDDHVGQRVTSLATYLSPTPLPEVRGDVTLRCEVPGLPLAPGCYPLSLSIGHSPFLDQLEDVVALEIHADDYLGNGKLPSRSLGQILARSKWTVLERDSRRVSSAGSNSAHG